MIPPNSYSPPPLDTLLDNDPSARQGQRSPHRPLVYHHPPGPSNMPAGYQWDNQRPINFSITTFDTAYVMLKTRTLRTFRKYLGVLP